MTGNAGPGPGAGRRPGAGPRRATIAADGGAADLEQPFDGDSLYALRAAVAAHGSQAGLSEGRTRDLVLVVHELAVNAVRHGAGHGRLRLWMTRDEVHCEVADDTRPPGADGAQPPGADGAGPAAGAMTSGAAAQWQIEPGHGLWLVRRVADEASVQSGPAGTVAAVSFRLDGPGPGPRGWLPQLGGWSVAADLRTKPGLKSARCFLTVILRHCCLWRHGSGCAGPAGRSRGLSWL
jgi:anti-sigma regulatory factor (Ser/Thr protein kinase)